MPLPNAQPRPRPAIFEKRDVLRDRERLARSVRAAIALRDKRRCRCCGRPGVHLHHLRYRSRGGGFSTENLITLDAGCHALIHAKQLWPLGTNADKRVTFELHEAACLDVFGVKPVPAHVRLITGSRGE